MAVGMLLTGELVTRDSYRQITEKMFGSYPMTQSAAPEGLILHTAGESEQGWYVYDVWESPEHFQRFAEGKLGPAIHELMGEVANPPQPQFFPIEVMEKGPAL
jgi:hypothetical protein